MILLVIVVSIVVLLLGGLLVTLYIVEREADYVLHSLGGSGEPRALILYHPSRDAHFTDELSLALAKGLKATGYSVDRATLTGKTPGEPKGYRLLVLVSNTFFFSPDLPTLRYLKRAKLTGLKTIGVIAGGGATTRSQKMLESALSRSGASILAIRAFWTSRPNDKKRLQEPNRELALEGARQLGLTAGKGQLPVLAPHR